MTAIISIAEKLAALRAARNKTTEYDSYASAVEVERVTLPNGLLSVHRDIYKAHLENAGRNDIDFLLSRPADEWDEILQAVERDNNVIMSFGVWDDE